MFKDICCFIKQQNHVKTYKQLTVTSRKDIFIKSQLSVTDCPPVLLQHTLLLSNIRKYTYNKNALTLNAGHYQVNVQNVL
jgi:hypothetical protein